MKDYSVNPDSLLKNDDIDFKFIEFSCDEQKHTHKGIEIVYVLDGMGEHVIDDNRIRMQNGSLLIMNNDCKHSFENIEPTKYYNLLFNPGFISDKLNKNNNLETLFKCCGFDISEKFIHINANSDEEISKLENLFFDILKEGIEQKQGYINFVKIRVAELINIIGRKYNEQGIMDETVDSLFNAAMEYINLNCCGELELEAVAAKFGYDPVYFSRMPKKHFGFSFKQLVIKKRFGRVLYYLWAEDSPIDDIIYKCGFTNKSHFYKLFETQFGVKPKYVREYWNNYYDIMCEKVKNKKV